jgi:hypothetical protein
LCGNGAKRNGKRGKTTDALLALGLAWLGLAWLGLAWLGLAWLGLAWLGLAWLGLAWHYIFVSECPIFRDVNPKNRGLSQFFFLGVVFCKTKL